MQTEERPVDYPSRKTVKKPNSYKVLLPSTSSHLLDCSQDLADLEDLIHLAVAREKRPESVQLGHNASDSPQVNGGTVSRRSEQHLRSSVPAQRAFQTINEQTLFRDVKQKIADNWSSGGDANGQNSPSSWHIVGVGGFGADLSSQSKICYLDQLRAHTQQVLGLHVPMKETWNDGRARLSTRNWTARRH